MKRAEGLVAQLGTTSDRDAANATVSGLIATLSEVAVYVNTAEQLGYVDSVQTQSAREQLAKLAKQVATLDPS